MQSPRALRPAALSHNQSLSNRTMPMSLNGDRLRPNVQGLLVVGRLPRGIASWAASRAVQARASVKLTQKLSGYCSRTRRRKPTPSSPVAESRSPRQQQEAAVPPGRRPCQLGQGLSLPPGRRVAHPVAPGVGVRPARHFQQPILPGRVGGTDCPVVQRGDQVARPTSRPELVPRPPPGRRGARPARRSRKGVCVFLVCPGLVEVQRRRHGCRCPSTKVDRVRRIVSSRTRNC